MTWAEMIRQERLSIGRPITVLDKSVIKVDGITVRTLVYKPQPVFSDHMGGLYAHHLRVSTWITEKDGTNRHVGSTSTNNEWRKES